MDPTLEKQSEQSQEKQSGGLSQGINTLNRFVGRGIKNPLGKIGSGVATQAARSGFTAFLAANPWLWGVLVVIIIVFAFTFIIVAGGIPGAPTSESTSVASPIETPTPTPLAAP